MQEGQGHVAKLGCEPGRPDLGGPAPSADPRGIEVLPAR